VHWTEFYELASSTGFILLFMLLVWAVLAGAIYWSYVSGSGSMGEAVKFRLLEDDEPVAR
jgi:polyferredoxin